MKITIDLERCAGHGRCYALVPTLFDADDDGRPLLLSPVAPEELQREARRAVAGCPEQAISADEEGCADG